MGGVADDRKEWEIYIDARGTRRGIKLAEQLVYSGGISHEMVVHATRLESWEVSDVEHDIIHKKRSRLQQLRDLAYGIEEAELIWIMYRIYFTKSYIGRNYSYITVKSQMPRKQR